jgi:hypothetical protein
MLLTLLLFIKTKLFDVAVDDTTTPLALKQLAGA